MSTKPMRMILVLAVTACGQGETEPRAAPSATTTSAARPKPAAAPTRAPNNCAPACAKLRRDNPLLELAFKTPEGKGKCVAACNDGRLDGNCVLAAKSDDQIRACINWPKPSKNMQAALDRCKAFQKDHKAKRKCGELAAAVKRIEAKLRKIDRKEVIGPTRRTLDKCFNDMDELTEGRCGVSKTWNARMEALAAVLEAKKI